MASLKGLPDALRGVAWSSSARTVRRPVNSGNGRDPCPQLLTFPAMGKSTLRGLPRKLGGRGGRRSVRMARIPGATRGPQWQEQWDATPKGGANPLNLVEVRIEGCNSPS